MSSPSDHFNPSAHFTKQNPYLSSMYLLRPPVATIPIFLRSNSMSREHLPHQLSRLVALYIIKMKYELLPFQLKFEILFLGPTHRLCIYYSNFKLERLSGVWHFKGGGLKLVWYRDSTIELK